MEEIASVMYTKIGEYFLLTLNGFLLLDKSNRNQDTITRRHISAKFMRCMYTLNVSFVMMVSSSHALRFINVLNHVLLFILWSVNRQIPNVSNFRLTTVLFFYSTFKIKIT